MIYNYSTGFMVACSYLGMCVGYYHRNKFKELKWMYLYPFASFLQVCFGFFVDKNTGVFTTFEESKLLGVSPNIFFITELFLVYNFFIQILKSDIVKKGLHMLSILFLSLTFFYSFFTYEIFHDLWILQSFCALVPCYFYFHELFNDAFLPDLERSPIFWVALGISLYFSCTFPIFVLADYLFEENIVIEGIPYSIGFIFYGILFLMIIRAYLFKSQKN